MAARVARMRAAGVPVVMGYRHRRDTVVSLDFTGAVTVPIEGPEDIATIRPTAVVQAHVEACAGVDDPDRLLS